MIETEVAVSEMESGPVSEADVAGRPDQWAQSDPEAVSEAELDRHPGCLHLHLLQQG